MISRMIVFCALLGLLLPAATGAVELEPSIAVDTTWTDDVFFRTRDESDVTVRVSPAFDFIDRDGRVTWKFGYEPSYEYYLDLGQLRGWDHEVNGELSWAISKRTRLTVSDRFLRFRSLQRLNEAASSATNGFQPTSESGLSRSRLKRNSLIASLVHQLDARHQLSLNANHLIWDFSEDNRSDFELFSVNAGYTYILSDRTRIGLIASWRNREVTRDNVLQADGESLDIEQDTDFYTLSASLAHVFDKRWSFEITAGPASVEGADRFEIPSAAARTQLNFRTINDDNGRQRLIDTSTCPTLPDGRFYLGVGCQPTGPSNFLFGGGRNLVVLPFQSPLPDVDGSSLTVFADLSVTHRFESGNVVFSFRRDEDQSASTGSSGVSNLAELRFNYRPSPKWTHTGWITYLLREQVVDQNVPVTVLTPAPITVFSLVPPAGFQTVTSGSGSAIGLVEVGRDDDTTTLRVGFGTDYRMDRQTSIRFRVGWQDEERTIGSVTTRDDNRWSLFVGFVHNFEPIKF